MRDIVIIGGGPAGLSAGIYAKRAGLDVVVLDKNAKGAGQISESRQVDNYIGMVGMSGYEMADKFYKDAVSLEVEIADKSAAKITKAEGGFTIELSDNMRLKTKTIIYSAGATHRRLGIAAEEKYQGKGISYCAVCDGMFYRSKDVAVIGGGNTALDDALYLSEICGKVYVIHRRDEFRGSSHTLNRLKNRDNVELVTKAQLIDISGEPMVSTAILDNGRRIDVNGIFIAVGMEPETELVKELVELDESGYIVAGEDGKTSLDGIFAAGDVRTKTLRQVVTAVSDGANAAISAEGYIRNR